MKNHKFLLTLLAAAVCVAGVAAQSNLASLFDRYDVKADFAQTAGVPAWGGMTTWVAADGNYWNGGRVTTDGKKAGLKQENSRVGVTFALPIRRQQLRVSYSFGAYTRLGGDFHSVGLSYNYAWAARR